VQGLAFVVEAGKNGPCLFLAQEKEGKDELTTV
jgi:hypothetical protein